MQQIEFQLNGEYVELNQLLKMVGLCDSGGAGKAIREMFSGTVARIYCSSTRFAPRYRVCP